jgi:hypothetical protein
LRMNVNCNTQAMSITWLTLDKATGSQRAPRAIDGVRLTDG